MHNKKPKKYKKEARIDYNNVYEYKYSGDKVTFTNNWNNEEKNSNKDEQIFGVYNIYVAYAKENKDKLCSKLKEREARIQWTT